MEQVFRYRQDVDRTSVHLASAVGPTDTDFQFVNINLMTTDPEDGLYLIHDEVIEVKWGLFYNRALLGSDAMPHSKGSFCLPIKEGTLEDTISALTERVTELERQVLYFEDTRG